MTVTEPQVRAKLNASSAAVTEDAIKKAIAAATILVNKHLGSDDGSAIPADVTIPQEIHDLAVERVAIEQLNQDMAPNGVLNQSYDFGTDGVSTPLRISRDPMKPALPILAPWTSGRFFCA